MAFSDPKNNIEQFGLSKGMMVADLGAGSGFYSIESAKAVGSEGIIYAVDVQKDLLERLKQQARLEGVVNIETIWGDVEKLGGTKIAPFSVDAVIVSNILFQIEDKNNFLQEVKRILRPNGRILVVDWTSSFGGLGPTPETVFDEIKAKELFGSVFEFVKNISAGDHHYGLIFRKR